MAKIVFIDDIDTKSDTDSNSEVEYKLPEELRADFSYDGCLVKRKRLTKHLFKNTKEEFIGVIELVIEREFYPEEFSPRTNVDYPLEFYKDLEYTSHYCICGTRIYNLYYIQDKTTRFYFLVGSCCVKKVSEQLYNGIMNRACKQCESVVDKRTTPGKLGFCSSNCHRNYKDDRLIMNMGKHQGKSFLWILQNDVSYCKWIMKNAKYGYHILKFKAYVNENYCKYYDY